MLCFFFQAEDGIRDHCVTGVQTCALPISGVPVLWLDAPIEVLLARCLTMTGRPLFRDEASFRTLHAERLPSYQLADHRVESSSEPAEIVAQILRLGIVASGGNQTHLVVEKPLS